MDENFGLLGSMLQAPFTAPPCMVDMIVMMRRPARISHFCTKAVKLLNQVHDYRKQIHIMDIRLTHTGKYLKQSNESEDHYLVLFALSSSFGTKI